MEKQEGVGEIQIELNKLRDVIEMIDRTQHTHNKIDALEEFEKIEKSLIDSGHFSSEDEVLKALENNGVKYSAKILEIIRAVRG